MPKTGGRDENNDDHLRRRVETFLADLNCILRDADGSCGYDVVDTKDGHVVLKAINLIAFSKVNGIPLD